MDLGELNEKMQQFISDHLNLDDMEKYDVAVFLDDYYNSSDTARVFPERKALLIKHLGAEMVKSMEDNFFIEDY